MPLFLFGTGLDELIIKARNSQPAQIASLKARASALQADSLKMSYLPALKIGASYTQNSGKKVSLVPNNRFGISAGLSFMLFDGWGREGSIDALEHLAQAENLKSQDEQNRLALLATRLYYELKNISKAIRAKQGEKEYLLALLKRVEGLFEAGLASDDELLGIKSSYALASAELIEISQQEKELKSQLSLLVGEFDELDFGFSFASLDSKASPASPAIGALEQESMAANALVIKARSNFWPKFFLQDNINSMRSDYGDKPLGVEVSGTPLDHILSASRVFRKSIWYNELSIGFTWQVFEWGASLKELEKARADALGARLALDYKTRENNLAIQNAKDSLNSISDKISALSLRESASKAALNAARSKYEAGLLSYSDMLLAVANSFASTAALAGAENLLELKKAELFYLMGDDLLKRLKR